MRGRFSRCRKLKRIAIGADHILLEVFCIFRRITLCPDCDLSAALALLHKFSFGRTGFVAQIVLCRIHCLNPSCYLAVMSSWTPTKYKTRNWAEYNLSLKQRGSLSIWFDPEIAWEASPSGRRGRQQSYSDAAIQACLTLKVLFGLPLRQTTGFVASLLELVGLDWSVPDFSTLCRRQKTLSVAIPYKGSTGPLHLLIDSTGIKAEGEGEWNARKHGGPKRRL